MMRNIPLIAIIAFISTGFYMCGQKSENRSPKESIIEFDTLSHNFGELEFNGDGDTEFIFTNTGRAPLIITHVKSTCGCTIPEWPKEPIVLYNLILNRKRSKNLC